MLLVCCFERKLKKHRLQFIASGAFFTHHKQKYQNIKNHPKRINN